MRINGLPSDLLKVLYGEGNGLDKGKRREQKGGELYKASVSVEITQEVVNLSPQEVSREKVERIKEAIRNGTYQVDPHRISEAIIKEILGDDL